MARQPELEDEAQPHLSDVGEALQRFTERLEAVAGHVTVADSINEAAQAIVALAGERGTRQVIAAAELTEALPALRASVESAGLSWRVPQTFAETRDAPLGLSLGRLAVAETGSVLLAETTLKDRAVGLLSAAQMVICPKSLLVPTLAEATPMLVAMSTRGAYTSFVTGPSRTADIERELTVGVQGPAKFNVLFIPDQPIP